MDLPGRLRRLPFPLRAPTAPVGIEPADTGPRLGAEYDTAWARKPVARVTREVIINAVMRPGVQLLGSPEIRGLDRLDHVSGPVVFAANHHSHVDTPVMLTAIPERWRKKMVVGAAADYFFHTRLSAAYSALVIGAIPIERNKVGRRSADLARSLVTEGWSLLIFPEGGRSPDGWGQPFRGGAAYIAMRAQVPVVPVHLDGTGRVLPKGGSLTRAKITITFGGPMTPLEREDARKFAARIEVAVAALADEAATDWWQARRRAHRRESPGLGGPATGAWRRNWALSSRESATVRRRRRWPEL